MFCTRVIKRESGFPDKLIFFGEYEKIDYMSKR